MLDLRAASPKKKAKFNWQTLVDSNHRMSDSKSNALPLGEGPVLKQMAFLTGIEPVFPL